VKGIATSSSIRFFASGSRGRHSETCVRQLGVL
jgi:hypothetical protein